LQVVVSTNPIHIRPIRIAGTSLGTNILARLHNLNR
jgi:hypothetical protein